MRPPIAARSLAGPDMARRWTFVLGTVGTGILLSGLVANYLNIGVAPGPTFPRALLAEGARLLYADAEGNAWSCAVRRRRDRLSGMTAAA